MQLNFDFDFVVLWNRCYLLAEIWNCALNLLWVSERGKFLTLFTSLVIYIMPYSQIWKILLLR